MRLLLLAAACSGEPDPPAHPTVALVTVDTWRHDHFSATHTPNLWALAAAGERFDAAWSPIGLTSPAHATMFTGLAPWEHGMEANNHHGYHLRGDVAVLPDRFPGYRSGAFVSAYPAGPDGGLGRGWQTFDGPESGERSGDETVARALDWLTDDAPTLLWVHVYEPHGPYEGEGATDVERYAEEVALADALLAPLLTELRRRRARIVVAADHGEVLLEETCGRQHERSTSPHVLHVPLFRWSPDADAAVRPERVGLDIVPELLAGDAWGTGRLQARAVTLAESGICEPGCAPGCRPPGVAGRDRVAIDDGGRWVRRPGRGTWSEGSPRPEHRAAVERVPAVPPPGGPSDAASLEALGYTSPSPATPARPDAAGAAPEESAPAAAPP